MAIALVVMTLVCMSTLTVHAQGKAAKLPPFTIKQADGSLYKAENLPHGKPVLLFYFSPDCDHCVTLMNDFFKKTEAFKKASIVMITYLPVERVVQFNDEHKTKRFSNLVIGTEGFSFFVRNYYHLMEMPFAALHDKNGNMVKSYTRKIPLDELSIRMNQLK